MSSPPPPAPYTVGRLRIHTTYVMTGVLILCVVILFVARYFRLEDDGFWHGTIQLVFAVLLPAAIFIVANMKLGRRAAIEAVPVAPFQKHIVLTLLWVTAIAVVVALVLVCFVLQSYEEVPVAGHPDKTENIPIPFPIADGVGDICTFWAPLLTLILSLELVAATSGPDE